MVEVVSPPSGCYVFQRRDQEDAPKDLNIVEIIAWLKSQFHFVSFIDTDEIYYYYNGIYRPNGEKLINRVLEETFGELTDRRGRLLLTGGIKKSVHDKIRDSSYANREDFDKDVNIINMANGLYNWRTKEFTDHDPHYLSLIQIPVMYNPNVDCPNIKKSFNAAIEKDDLTKMREFIAYCLYYTMSSDSNQSGYPIQKAFILYGSGAAGKALEIHTPIPTPTGFTQIKDLVAGDEVFDENGNICHVVAKTPIFRDRNVYEVCTKDGDKIIADEEHLWRFHTDWDSRYKIRNTKELYSATRSRYATIHIQGALDLPNADLPIDPYVLGVWLGNGCSISGMITEGLEDVEWMKAEITKLGYEVTNRKAEDDFTVRKMVHNLRDLGLLRNKHIPMIYKRASKEQRLALLQGLVDTDGYVSPRGGIEYCGVNKQLAEDVLELIRTLGISAALTEGDATLDGRFICKKYRIHFMAGNAARLPRKAKYCKDKTKNRDRAVKVEPCGKADTICIQVDSNNGMFLAGRSFLPTHNSFIMMIIRSFVGVANTSSVGLQDMGTDRFATADMFGKLLNLCGDLDGKTLTNDGDFKKATSGFEPLRAQKKGLQPFDFINVAKMIFGTNRLLACDDRTTGFFRRIEPIIMKKLNPDDIPYLPTKEDVTTPEEMSGLFNWVIGTLQGLIERRHFTNEKGLGDVIKVYLSASNPIDYFVENYLEEAPNNKIPKRKVYESFEAICYENDVFEVPSQTKFWIDLRKAIPDLEIRTAKVDGKLERCIVGYKLNFDWNGDSL